MQQYVNNRHQLDNILHLILTDSMCMLFYDNVYRREENPFAVHLGRIQALRFKPLYRIVDSSTFSVEDYWQCNLFLICTVQQYNFLVATIKIISTCYIQQHFEQAALMEANQRDWIKVNWVWVKVFWCTV